MYRLYLFLYKYRVALIFVFLEFLCGWLIIQNNRFQRAAFLNSSNVIAGNLLSASREIKGYFNLKRINQDLAGEVAYLREEIEKKKTASSPSTLLQDSSFIPFQFITAKVVNNSIYNFNNYLTINKGENAGVKSGMGVIGLKGIVGKVKYTSANYSVVTSILHSDFLISSKVGDKVNLCSTQWDSKDPFYAKLLFVPRHISLEVGDTVSTSGFNSIFPEDILIGTISKLDLRTESPFYDAEIKLATDFSKLTYVQVVISALRNEKDSLELKIDEF